METITLPAGAAPAALDTRDWAEAQTRLLEDHLERRVAERTRDLRGRYEHEHRLAETLRRALLLAAPLSRVPGLAVETASVMASAEGLVGGDFCDVFPLRTGEVALVLGDVSGKGLVAALRVPEVKFALRAFLSEHGSPARALSGLNDWLCLSRGWAADPGAAFATAAVVVLDAGTGQGLCSLAGAEAPFLLRPLGRPDRVGTPGTALGVEAGRVYESCAFELGVGDLLLMTTDGVTEARRGQAYLGDAGLSALAQDAWQTAGPSQAWSVARSVLAGARLFADGALHDDACVLAAERRPN